MYVAKLILVILAFSHRSIVMSVIMIHMTLSSLRSELVLETVNIRFCLVTIVTFLHQSWAQFCYQLRRVGPKLGFVSVLSICIFDSSVIFLSYCIFIFYFILCTLCTILHNK